MDLQSRLKRRLKCLLCKRRRRERKFGNILQESGIFMHLEEKTAQIVDLFPRLGRGC